MKFPLFWLLGSFILFLFYTLAFSANKLFFLHPISIGIFLFPMVVKIAERFEVK